MCVPFLREICKEGGKMRENITRHRRDFVALLDSITVTSSGGDQLSFEDGVEKISGLFSRNPQHYKVIFIGNGGSAAIASHMAIDFWKNGGIRAICFNEGSLLTCIGNDYGYHEIFARPLQAFADRDDVLVAISSSGKSQNILNGVKVARDKGCAIVTLSGFDNSNPLFSQGDMNFHVPSNQYGPVEVAHQYILHCVLDVLMEAH